jgi:Domain of unknown function (DUF4387)
MTDVTRYCSLIRSKDAGPFMLTLDFFFVDDGARRALTPVLSPERIGALYGVEPSSVEVYELPEINALKISFPRRVVSGDCGDTDITGGQQYALVVEMIESLDLP